MALMREVLFKLLPINKEERKDDQLVIFSSMLLIVLVLLSISTTAIFLLYDDLMLNIGNLLVLPVIIYFFLRTKKASDVPRSSILLLSFVFVALLYNIYEIGLGINVIDIIWFTIVILAAILFVNTRAGILFFSVTILAFLVLIWDESHNRIFYNSEGTVPDSNYNFITFLFYTSLLFATILSFINIIKKLQERNKILSEQKINELDVLVKARTKEIENLRRQIAMDFHDEMGNKLASIVSLTDIISIKMSADPDSVRTSLKNIRKKSQELYDGTRDFLWTINAFDNSIKGLYEHVTYFGQEFFAEVGIEFNCSNLSRSNVSLTSGQMFNLIMLIKEAMSNITKHSKAKKVNLTMNETEYSFVIVINDNGVGFDLNTTSSGMGLKNMKDRSDKAGVQFKLTSEIGKGTSLEIEVKK